MNNFGLSEKTIFLLMEFFQKYSGIEQVIIFGSRATGNFKNSSDIDFAIKGKNIDFKFIQHISAEIDELSTPYMYDIVDYNSITNKNLLENVNKFGKVFYTKQ
ncbi:nucleotidyltransferase domain-containing protein [bacterium]|nr:nucleotidyltransferase domain-containing protein [bacterium]